MNIEVGAIGGATVAAGPSDAPIARETVRLRLQLALLVSDCAAIALAFAFAGWSRLTHVDHSDVLTALVALIPVYVAIALNGDAYGTDVLRQPRKGIARALTALLVSIASVVFVAFCLKASGELSRLFYGIGASGSALIIVAFRRTILSWSDRRFHGSLWNEILICDGATIDALPSYRRFDAKRLGLVPTIDDPMMLDRLGRFLQHVDRVVVACAPERRERWASALKGANVKGEVLAPELGAVGALGISRYGSCSTMVVATGPLGMRKRLMKRGMDLAIAVPALLAVAPLLVLVAIAIRLDSPGPILFVQQRLGRGNRLFGMYKFRSMRTDLCDAHGTQSTQRDDDRVTRVGRIIRATSIDELPQLFNILLGDMSFVGPRPHALGSTAGDRLFWEVDERYWHRHAIKPGITGLAQVRGFRGATHATTDLTNRLQADLEYLNGWTIWRDVSILLRTFKVLVHKNAF